MRNSKGRYQKTRSDADRFWSKVARCQADECWLWQGYRNRRGYGQFRLGSRVDKSLKMVHAHRAAYFFSYGEWPEPMALHSCDDRACCNPAHIRAGTHNENMADMATRRRSTHGEQNASAKLTARDVQLIRLLCGRIGLAEVEVAARYGVNHTTVHAIVHWRSWKHIPDIAFGKPWPYGPDEVRQATERRRDAQTARRQAPRPIGGQDATRV